MTCQTYHGSCHCGAIAFEADIDLADGTTKCNCTWCLKNRYWSLAVPPDRFRALKGVAADALTPARCSTCGVLTWARQAPTDWDPVEKVVISVAALDDADPAALAEAPVRYCDGRHDNWWEAPAEVRHL
ncbi:GFA family protein [Wenxinia marina]|uniref:CENP-V/GFA domain-containing protein n=1 Tax=Wenxinia marina DSM 24838 TaxID=1123501 RepID=A0A0D0Q4R5_9RHOB|nr:hypothetical protein [Wenxinia marina]KIQ67537.1 hypothetical protein Wenmar_03962 [Wenxinia marina DSM 24838]GGL68667.1 aldehyde-activating protein [Wenxinia marina]